MVGFEPAEQGSWQDLFPFAGASVAKKGRVRFQGPNKSTFFLLFAQ